MRRTAPRRRPSAGARWASGALLVQPLACVAAVVLALVYVHTAGVSDTEQRSLGVRNLLTLLRQHLTISLAATLLTCVVAIPLGIALTRGPMRRYAKPITTVAGFGQAAPAIGLIALGAVLFGIGNVGRHRRAHRLRRAADRRQHRHRPRRRRPASWSRRPAAWACRRCATLLQVELPLALRVIVAGVRTALVLIVGTASLASFTGAGGLGQLITTGIKLQQDVTLVVGAVLVAALALFIDWLARLVEVVAAPKGV